MVGAIITGGIIVTVFLTTSANDKKPAGNNNTNLFVATSPLADASKTCTTGTLGDDNHTLIIDMAGEEPGSGTATIDDINCVMDELEVPQSVRAQMGSTRALDGMQSATWSTYKATWTYHPNNGLDVIITYTS